MRGCRGVCMVAGGHAWLQGACVVAGGVHGCKGVGGMHGCRGVCMVVEGMRGWGGMHGFGGACVVVGACVVAGGGMRGIRRDTVNERVVRILLECILVLKSFYSMQRWGQCFQSVFFVVLAMNNIISHILDLTRNKVRGTSKSRKR